MRNTNTTDLYAIIDHYVIPADKVFQLCSESLCFFFKRMAGRSVTEAEVAECLRTLGYSPLKRDGEAWQYGDGPAWFRLRFVRDEATRGLFDCRDESLCFSRHLRTIVHNATENKDRRMRKFCHNIINAPELCRRGLTDSDTTSYLRWLARHTPSSKSVFAATLLYYIGGCSTEVQACLSSEQLQFIRENPELKPILTPC